MNIGIKQSSYEEGVSLGIGIVKLDEDMEFDFQVSGDTMVIFGFIFFDIFITF